MVQDPVFWNAMGVTLCYVVLNIGFQTVFALVIAVMTSGVGPRGRCPPSAWCGGS
jgi:ABC-type sugar transport system permease subunit